MRYILDTNIVSELTKPVPAPECIEWLAAHASECCLTTITLAEMRFGVERLADGKRRRVLERKYDYIRQDFQDWIFDFDEAAATEFGRYAAEYEAVRGARALEQADIRDLLIAAVSRAQGATIVTRNTRHFPSCATLNPFEAS